MTYTEAIQKGYQPNVAKMMHFRHALSLHRTAQISGSTAAANKLDAFLAEIQANGWADEFDAYLAESGNATATETAQLIQMSGLTQKAFAERFEIPLRTVEDWVAGRRCPPPYVVSMIKQLLDK